MKDRSFRIMEKTRFSGFGFVSLQRPTINFSLSERGCFQTEIISINPSSIASCRVTFVDASGNRSLRVKFEINHGVLRQGVAGPFLKIIGS